MNYVNNFAFFWVGDDITIPSYLTKSINLAYKNDVNIYMLTDKKTPYIEGVTKTIRTMLPKTIMLARLKAYSELKIDEQVLFLDADSLVLNKFSKILSNESLILFRRKKEGIIINSNYPEYYPEFVNQTFDDMMPFLFGAILTTTKKSYKNFLTILEYARKLPSRFHRWYGDQYALKLAVDDNLIYFSEKNFSEYVGLINEEKDLIGQKRSIITFKGQTKHLLPTFFNKLSN